MGRRAPETRRSDRPSRATAPGCCTRRRCAGWPPRRRSSHPWDDDFPRTRLTHSSRSARSVASSGRRSAATRTWSRPPAWPTTSATRRSGTTARSALDEAAKACGGFEGNAQTLRILTRLEAKAFDADGAASASTSPGPLWTARPSTRGSPREGSAKYGVYADDAAGLRVAARRRRRTAQPLPRGAGHGLVRRRRLLRPRPRGRARHAGHLSLAALRDPAERAEVAGLAAGALRRRRRTADDIVEALRHAARQPAWWPSSVRRLPPRPGRPQEPDVASSSGASHRRPSAATRDAYGPRVLSRYGADLVVPTQTRLECAAAQGGHRASTSWAGTALPSCGPRQRDIIRELVAALVGRRPRDPRPGAAAGVRGGRGRRRPAAGRRRPGGLPDGPRRDRAAPSIDRVTTLVEGGVMSGQTYVVIGGGLAGAKAAETLRDRGLRRADRADRRRERAAVRAPAAVQGLPARQGRRRQGVRPRRGLVRRARRRPACSAPGPTRDRRRPSRPSADRRPRRCTTTSCCWRPAPPRAAAASPAPTRRRMHYLRTLRRQRAAQGRPQRRRATGRRRRRRLDRARGHRRGADVRRTR